jgi:uncharacterized protein (DUF58 family)
VSNAANPILEVPKPGGLHAFLEASEREKIERLFLESRSAVEGNLAGRHRNQRHGSGTEFSDHRPYIPGDDPRRIDWKVLGRTERCFLRQYQDETNLRVYLIVDRSASMGYGTCGITKYDYACKLAAALGYIVVRNRDSLGMHLYAGGPIDTAPARHTLLHLNHCMEKLRQSKPDGTTATAETLHRIAETVRRRALMVVISDLLDDQVAVLKSIAHFRRQHHDVILFQILDPSELDISKAPDGDYEDLETGEKLTTSPRAMASGYQALFHEFIQEYRRGSAEMKVDHRLVNTADPVIPFVRHYLEQRERLSN